MLLRVNAAELQRQRESKNMTPYRLAVEAGLPVNAIYRLEDGTTKMTNHLVPERLPRPCTARLRIFLLKRKEPEHGTIRKDRKHLHK